MQSKCSRLKSKPHAGSDEGRPGLCPMAAAPARIRAFLPLVVRPGVRKFPFACLTPPHQDRRIVPV